MFIESGDGWWVNQAAGAVKPPNRTAAHDRRFPITPDWTDEAFLNGDLLTTGEPALAAPADRSARGQHRRDRSRVVFRDSPWCGNTTLQLAFRRRARVGSTCAAQRSHYGTAVPVAGRRILAVIGTPALEGPC